MQGYIKIAELMVRSLGCPEGLIYRLRICINEMRRVEFYDNKTGKGLVLTANSLQQKLHFS